MKRAAATVLFFLLLSCRTGRPPAGSVIYARILARVGDRPTMKGWKYYVLIDGRLDSTYQPRGDLIEGQYYPFMIKK